jgi:hypothetical protein
MRHGGNNKFQMKLNGNSDYVIRNLATSQDIITLPIGGGINFSNLPTTNTTLSLGDIWRDGNGFLKVKI